MKKELSDFKVSDYHTPYGNFILVKWEDDSRTDNGVIIPEHLREKKRGLEVLAVGCDVTKIKPGDLISPTPNMEIGTFSVFDTLLFQIPDYHVYSIISKDYEKANKEFKKLKEFLSETTID